MFSNIKFIKNYLSVVYLLHFFSLDNILKHHSLLFLANRNTQTNYTRDLHKSYIQHITNSSDREATDSPDAHY